MKIHWRDNIHFAAGVYIGLRVVASAPLQVAMSWAGLAILIGIALDVLAGILIEMFKLKQK